MEKLNNLSKVFNIAFPYRDFLYILQLEEYFNIEYLKSSLRLFFRRNIERREKLKFTSRIQTTLAVTITYQAYFTLVAVLLTNNIAVSILLSLLTTPLFVGIANITLTPIYNTLKRGIQKRAQTIISQTPNTKIIAVAGSFGKTTTKNLIYEMIRFNYKTQMIQGNLNTPIGVAGWIINNFDKTTEYLIVEMDAFVPNAISQICKITPPDIAVITNIGEQHMTRFRNEKELIKAHLELFFYKPRVLVCTEKVYKKLYSVEKINEPIQLIKPKLESKKFSDSLINNIQLATTVAKNLNVRDEIIQDSISKFQVPDRRQRLTEIYGYTAIDDSYNISLSTAYAALNFAKIIAQQQGKKIITITAGIPESNNHKTTNRELGRYLSKYSHQTIVLNSIFSKFLKSKNSLLANNMDEAWSIIKQSYNTDQIVVLILPELTDLYY